MLRAFLRVTRSLSDGSGMAELQIPRIDTGIGDLGKFGRKGYS